MILINLLSILSIFLSFLGLFGYNSVYIILGINYFIFQFILNNYLDLLYDSNINDYEGLIINLGILLTGILLSFNMKIEKIKNYNSKENNSNIKTSEKYIIN